MTIPLKDFPNQTVADRASESGKLESAVRLWAREVTFAVRALQNRPDGSAAVVAVASSSSSSAASTATSAPITVSGVASVNWGTGIRGNINTQADLMGKLAEREPKLGIPPSPNSVPVYQVDGTRDWSTLPDAGAIRTVSTDTLLGTVHSVVVVANGSAITLPKASNFTNKRFTVVRSGVLPVTITPDGTETISGAALVTLAVQWDFLSIISDGTQWIRYA